LMCVCVCVCVCVRGACLGRGRACEGEKVRELCVK